MFYEFVNTKYFLLIICKSDMLPLVNITLSLSQDVRMLSVLIECSNNVLTA